MQKNIPFTHGMKIGGNPVEITKEMPYFTRGLNRSQRRRRTRDMSNKKGRQIIITQLGIGTFAKTERFKNHLGDICYNTTINGKRV